MDTAVTSAKLKMEKADATIRDLQLALKNKNHQTARRLLNSAENAHREFSNALTLAKNENKRFQKSLSAQSEYLD